MLVGRNHECQLIDQLLTEARHGASQALVIRDEAGIGKTALLEHVAQGGAMTTLRCTGVESERDLAFAGLEQLFRPVLDVIDALPGPQAAALRSAFGLSSDRVGDRLLIGLVRAAERLDRRACDRATREDIGSQPKAIRPGGSSVPCAHGMT